ncbi:MAG: TlpA disulfide reductase family protein [Flavobacterium nitrogenifigens]|uniref:TlpA family protein disulfide reductase n=1 Tax=Flavobacterium nitrogenifigens TaxID=1617283 RepID=UPI00280808AF|nr:TlpA disulfide reductase family protein [Flavobacterium nitrogenifigens]MDQ8013220.1 TlpA disulfide reductase family protein [Flavobacterium nitrogenifigens]
MKKLLFFIALTIASARACHSQTEEAKIKSEIAELHKDLRKTQDSIGALIIEQTNKAEKTENESLKEKLDKELAHLWSIYDAGLREEAARDLSFAMLHPDSAACLKLILKKVQTQEGLLLFDRYLEVFQNFSAEIKSSEDGKKMEEKLKYFKQNKEGSPAPDFTLADAGGEKISLSDFKNKKNVLLDFWASWCAPCIEDQKYLKEIYNQYKSTGFEIISISRDTDKEKWKSSIAKHKINIWKQILTESSLNICSDDQASIKPSIDVEYFVSSIPHYVLIDKSGIIIGKWKNSGQQNMKELEDRLSLAIGE